MLSHEPSPSSGAVLGVRARTISLVALALRLRSRSRLQGFLDLWHAYGDLPHVRVGSTNLFLVVHPEHIRHISLSARQSFDKLTSYDGPRALLLGDGLVASTGELWKRQRRLLSTFFTPRGIEQYYPVMTAVAEATARRWDEIARTDRTIDMIDEMMLVTATIILRTMFGKSGIAEEQMLSISDDVGAMIRFVTLRPTTLIKAPLWAPVPSHVRYRRARARVHGFIQDLIAQRRGLPEQDWPDDLLSKLMLARDDETGEPMTDQLVRDESINIFIAGHETTARTMSFLFCALHENPDIAMRLHAELDSVLDRDEVPTIQQLKRLPYTLQVIKEVLRLYPAVPLYVRDAAVDEVMHGVPVPAGSRMLAFPYATHRHPDFWEEPDRFDPDRWLPEREAARHPCAYHPFAAGQRICIGNNFSLLESHVLTAMLARRFMPRLQVGHRPEFEVVGTLNVLNGLPMQIARR